MRVLGAVKTFTCLGGECPDTCCAGWRIPLVAGDRERWQRLGIDAILSADTVTRDDGEVDIRKEDDRCVHQSADGLCGVQARWGSEAQAWICVTYPRVARTVGGVAEVTATLSCPEIVLQVVGSDAGPRWTEGHPSLFSREIFDDAGRPAGDPWLLVCERVTEALAAVLTDRRTSLRARLLRTAAVVLAMTAHGVSTEDPDLNKVEAVLDAMRGDEPTWARAVAELDAPLKEVLTWIDGVFGPRYDGSTAGPLLGNVEQLTPDQKLESAADAIARGRALAGDDPERGPWVAFERLALHAIHHEPLVWNWDWEDWTSRFMLRMALLRAVLWLQPDVPEDDDPESWLPYVVRAGWLIGRSVDHGKRDEVDEAWTAPEALRGLGAMALLATV